MATPVTAAMQQIVTLWTALVPPDRPDRPYHHIDKREPGSWTVLDRGSVFKPPARTAPEAQTAARSATLVEWSVDVDYHVTRKGRGIWDFMAAVANETSQLTFAVEAAASWPAGISEVFVEASEPDEAPEGATISLQFTVLCEDT